MSRWMSTPIAVAWVVLAWGGTADCANDRQPSRLAILVSDETDDPAIVQTLLEAEASRVWSGDLIERKELDLVLRERQLAAARTASDRLQLGQLLHADYLLIVRCDGPRVDCLVNRFPDATVIAEFQLSRSSPDGLAKRIAVRAFQEINARESKSDKNKLHVSLGSLLCDDPFQRYATFGDELHQRLRQQLASHPRLVVAERFHPTHLLREFQLGRAGLTRTVAASLTAPASDVLIVGEFQPSHLQPLEGKSVELSFAVQLLSPTGLFPARKVEFKTNGPDVAQAARNIESALRQLADSLSGEPSRRSGAEELDREFLTLKQQAFRLMPYPPGEDGNFHTQRGYHGSLQSGCPPHTLDRALRAVENAMLFRDDDTQLLVCAGVLLQGQSLALRWREGRGNGNSAPSLQERALLEAGFELLENALLLESNPNTRGVCCEAISWRDRPLLPERVTGLAERITREGLDAGWLPHQVNWAWIWLAQSAPDIDAKVRHLHRAADSDVGPATLYSLLETVESHLLANREDNRVAEQATTLADDLTRRDSAFQRALGHYLHSRLDFLTDQRDLCWLTDFRRTIDLLHACHAEHGREFIQCNFSYRLYEMLRTLPGGPNHDELAGETLELFETYVARQAEIGNFGTSSMTQCMSLMLPVLYERGRYEDALQLLSPLVEHYDWGGAADFERMQLVRWQDHLRQAIAPELRLSRDQLAWISLPTSEHETRIKKLVHAADRIWVLRCDYWLGDRVGELFELPASATAANATKGARVVGVEGVVTDIAASSDQLAVTTIDHGLFLLDYTSKRVRHLEPGNSPLPSVRLRTVASADGRFYLGVPDDRSYHIYELDPQTNTLRDNELELSYHEYYQTKYSRSEKRLVMQTWDERMFDDGGQTLRLKRQPQRGAVHATTVTDDAGQTLFEHTGVELNYVYDFVRWHDTLVFATGNGLYVASLEDTVSLKDRELCCVMNELNLEFFSLCGAADNLYVGTNQGVFRIGQQLLDGLEKRPTLTVDTVEHAP